jgi:iron complex outermembrane receptor protein
MATLGVWGLIWRLMAAALAAAGLVLASPVWAGQPVAIQDGDPIDDLSRLSLEELATIEVTSVSRRPEALADAAAAIFVITRDDIRRSGAVSLPEVLRLAPNLDVQRVNSVDYAISARGFNGFETSNKLLVLIDGRSVYSTLSSGVFWDAQQVFLEDIERIEVISGPGGALYGSNAMNGVINIITRSAADTSGVVVTAAAGPEDQTAGIRVGGALGQAGAWRAYVSGFRADESERLTGGDATDPAEGVRGGVRMDGATGSNVWMIQGEAFDNTLAVNEEFTGDRTSVRGGDLLGRLTRPLGRGELQLQAYYDLFEREEPAALERGRTYDLNVQHASLWGRHQLVLGLGHRTVKSSFDAAPGAAFLDPADRTLTLSNLYLQDQIALRRDLTLTLGIKYEDNSFSGDELLPSARLAWAPGSGDLIWGAISRATRTPNRIERDLTLPGFLIGADFQSETATAYEVGYRAHRASGFTYSISAFYNVYEDLRTISADPVVLLPLRLTNHGEGETYGVEAWGSYDVTPAWRLSAGVSTLEKDFTPPEPILDISFLASIGDDPGWHASLRSQSRLNDDLDLDVTVRAVDDLAMVEGFVEADVRLAWRLSDHLEFSLTGDNLLEDRRVEAGDPVRARAFGRAGRLGLRAVF